MEVIANVRCRDVEEMFVKSLYVVLHVYIIRVQPESIGLHSYVCLSRANFGEHEAKINLYTYLRS